MAHNIATIDNQSAMFCVGGRDAAWHKLGQRTNGAATWQEAMQLAHLDWPVVEQDMYVRTPGTGEVIKVQDYKSVWRGNGSPAQLGVVGSDYHVIQNAQAFDFVDSLLQAQDGAHYESAGALGKGEKIWVMARVPGADIRIAGTDDLSKTYLLVATGHTANLSYVAKLCTERVVCENTLHVALGQEGALCRIRHTSGAGQRLDMAKRIAPSIVTDAKTLEGKLNLLAARRMTKDSMVSVLNRLWPENKDTDRQGRRDAVLTKVLELFESNDRNAIPSIRGTAYNMLNAVTEYTDHYRPVRMTSGVQGMTESAVRAQNAVFGAGESLKTSALTVLLEETKSNPAATATGGFNGSILDDVIAASIN
jgi:phage/plasmid-like protein (TIGR03299 family)